MPEYDRIDISEGIDVNNTNASNECDIYHYWCFKDIGFKYEPDLCNGCHYLMQKAMNLNDVAVVYVKRSAYRIHFCYMSKDDSISTMDDLILLINRSFCNFFEMRKKKSNTTYYKKKQRSDTN